MGKVSNCFVSLVNVMAELILVLLMSTLLAGNDACYELSTLTSSFEVEWANVKPYIYNSSAKKPTGLS